MGQRVLAFALCGVITLRAAALAGPVTLDNGVTGAGHLVVEPDEYGAYGNLLSPNQADSFQPAGEQGRIVSYDAGYFMFVTTPDNKRTAVLLTDNRNWINLLEPPPMGDGIAGDHALMRTITMANTVVGTSQARSEFLVEQAGGGPIQIKLALTQSLTATVEGGRLEQAFVITNTGTTDVALAFLAIWGTALIWGNSTFEDDVIGVGPTRCYLFEHDPGSTVRSDAMTDGGSTIPFTYYHSGKDGFDPPTGPVYDATTRPIFANRELPTSWRNHQSLVGYDTAGDTGASLGDGEQGLEYHFPLAIGASITIKVHRYYGTITPTCVVPAGAGCGNSVTDVGEQCDGGGVETATCNANCTTSQCGDSLVNAAAGEQCDSGGADTPGCNGATCTMAVCGDGYVNSAAGEACDGNGQDTVDCNASNCQPPACGDGYVNVAAGEQCEEDTGYCDIAVCQYNFTIGGGCAGCGAGGSSSTLLLVLAVLGLRRRRR